MQEQIADGCLSEALITLGEALGDDEMMLLSVGSEDDRGIVLVAQGDTAEMLLRIVGEPESEAAIAARAKRISQYGKPNE